MRPVTATSAIVLRAADRVWTLWREFWFKPADPIPLAVMRILFGGMLFYTHLVWGMNLKGFFGPSGWQGDTLVHTFQQGQYAWSFWWLVPGGLHLTVHILCLVVLALFAFGVFTPVTSILAYLITVSYAYRAPLANFGLDQINAIAALYLAIGPSGAALSIDRLWRRKRAWRNLGIAGRPSVEEAVVPSARANLALRLIQVHLCVIYIFACGSKLQGESWWGGQAIWQAVSNLEYQSTDLTWLAWYPWLVNVLTHGTVIWEMTFWALVWRPLCRPVVLLIGVAIHLGIGAFMGMWTFGLAMIFLYVAFVPATTIHAILRTVSRLFGRRSLALEQPAAAAAPVLEPPEDQFVDKRPMAAHLPIEPTVALPSAGDRATRGAELPTSAGRAARIDSDPLPLGRRPALVVVESRLKRQTQIQEYMVRRGFRCFVASDLHQARSLLCVVDIDAIVVTSTWFSDEDVAAFRDALIGGGPSLPASLFFVTALHHPVASKMSETDRHKLVHSALSLRELRLMIIEVLGQTDQTSRAARHSPAPPNGNGHGKKQADPSNKVPSATHSEDVNLESKSIGNGAQT
jgi:hypothetical protein